MPTPKNISSSTAVYGSWEILTSRVLTLEGGCIFMGVAQPGSSVDDPVWLITRNESVDGVNELLFANGSSEANQKWSDLLVTPIQFS